MLLRSSHGPSQLGSKELGSPGTKVAPMWHIGPQVPPNQNGRRELREGKEGKRGKGGRGIKSGWLATPMARYREEGTGEKVGRAGALCAT